MADQTQATLAEKTYSPEMLTISSRDREILRSLAEHVAKIADDQCQNELKDLWYSHNALDTNVRPLVFCDPENGWNEIITEHDLKCKGELAREWEFTLRKEIFWGESMGDDRVTESWFDVPYIYLETDWGLHEIKTGGTNGGSYRWEAPIKTYDDMEKLRFPQIIVNHNATNDLVALAEKTLGDLLNVRLKGKWWWSLGMTWTLVNLRGLEQIMFDCFDHPEDLKRLMAFLRDGHMAKIDFLEKNGLLSLNNDGTYVGSGGFGWTNELPQDDFNGHVRLTDMWGFLESQETVAWSPDLFGEFIFPYQLPLFERFGLNCYGCCEPINSRWKYVKQAARLRRVSVSPWADPEAMAEALGDRYIYSMKPHPTPLALPEMKEKVVRDELRTNLEKIKGCRIEIIMKDNHTIGNNPENVIRWCKIAREEAERIFSG